MSLSEIKIIQPIVGKNKEETKAYRNQYALTRICFKDLGKLSFRCVQENNYLVFPQSSPLRGISVI